MQDNFRPTESLKLPGIANVNREKGYYSPHRSSFFWLSPTEYFDWFSSEVLWWSSRAPKALEQSPIP